MTVKEYTEIKIQNIRDQEIVLRELKEKNWNGETEIPVDADEFLQVWNSVQDDLRKLYKDGLFW